MTGSAAALLLILAIITEGIGRAAVPSPGDLPAGPAPTPETVKDYLNVQATREDKAASNAVQNAIDSLASPDPVEMPRLLSDLRSLLLSLDRFKDQVAESLPPNNVRELAVPEFMFARKKYESALISLTRAHQLLDHLQAPLEKQSADRRPAADQIKKLGASAQDDLVAAKDATFYGTETVKAIYLDNATLVVSGGVSLGSYQAGFVYYYTSFLRAFADKLARDFPKLAGNAGRFKIATGASAGSINSFGCGSFRRHESGYLTRLRWARPTSFNGGRVGGGAVA